MGAGKCQEIEGMKTTEYTGIFDFSIKNNVAYVVQDERERICQCTLYIS